MSRKKIDRSRKIVDLLAKEKKMEVSSLAEILNVSQVTIRKDLNELEEKGLISREHGYAELRSSEDIGGRLAYHYDAKRKIAARAADLIHDGDTLMIESGSCCALLADYLAETKKDLTLITNSAFIADYIRHKASFEIILLGGIYQKGSQVMTGPLIRQCAANYFVHYLFIGADGYSEQTGFTNSDQMRAQAVRDMAPQAEEVIVLTESEKFLHHGIVPMNLPHQPKAVITDKKIPEDCIVSLDRKGCQVILTE